MSVENQSLNICLSNVHIQNARKFGNGLEVSKTIVSVHRLNSVSNEWCDDASGNPSRTLTAPVKQRQMRDQIPLSSNLSIAEQKSKKTLLIQVRDFDFPGHIVVHRRD
mmetsp:Transcript_49955/g.131452  ORF Transcript_49955/g.131452 Transcript_49955/m.131452 type:complete len:108 (+) Transcript_49955:202-525(+)